MDALKFTRPSAAQRCCSLRVFAVGIVRGVVGVLVEGHRQSMARSLWHRIMEWFSEELIIDLRYNQQCIRRDTRWNRSRNRTSDRKIIKCFIFANGKVWLVSTPTVDRNACTSAISAGVKSILATGVLRE